MTLARSVARIRRVNRLGVTGLLVGALSSCGGRLSAEPQDAGNHGALDRADVEDAGDIRGSLARRRVARTVTSRT